MESDDRIAISEIFRRVITVIHEFFVQSCVSFPRLHYIYIYLKYWGIFTHVINTVLLHTCLMYWLSFRTDPNRLLMILAKYFLSKEILCDIWLTFNLRGNKKNAGLFFTASLPERKGLFSQPATLNRIKIPRRKMKESFFLSSFSKFWIDINYQPARHYNGLTLRKGLPFSCN